MPSTHTCLHFHSVFSTKDRVSSILHDWRERLHEYLGGTLRGLNATPLRVGGVADHVHLLFGLKPICAPADVIRELKKASTSWVREMFDRKFQWQEGYGAFAVSKADVPAVAEYIANQEEHHRAKTFQAEYLEFLNSYGIQYDPKYLW